MTRWVTVIDHGGIGDILATAICLGLFRNNGVSVNFVTRFNDSIPSMLSVVDKSWDYLCSVDPSNQRSTNDTSGAWLMERSMAVLNFTPFEPSSGSSFYGGRIARMSSVLGDPSRLSGRPIKASGWKWVPNGCLIHAKSAWPEKDLGEQETVGLLREAHRLGLDPTLIDRHAPIASWAASASCSRCCVCVDSCMSHIAYWCGARLAVIHKTTDPNFLLAGMPPELDVGLDRPETFRGFDLDVLSKFLSESIK